MYNPVQLRSVPIMNLSTDEVMKMLKERNFFSTDAYGIIENKQGKGLNHQYELVEKVSKKLVIDHTTGLTWQQSGAPDEMSYTASKEYIKWLNDTSFADCNNWRLPTLEEAVSLMETEKMNNEGIYSLYINPIFDNNQRWIWTADKKNNPFVLVMWVVNFDYGHCYYYYVDGSLNVRAVH